MKKVKLTLITTTLLCLLLLIAGCAGGSKPSKSQVLEDLKTSFANDRSSWAEYMDIEKFEVELSESGEKEYTADLKVTAISKYAEFYWDATVEYVKYDQGWIIDDCDWDYFDYKVVKYPNEKEISEIVKYLKGQNATVEQIEILKNESKIACRVSNKVDWSEYGSGEVVSRLLLEYEKDDTWDEYKEEYIDDEFALDEFLSQTYTLKTGYYIGVGERWYKYTELSTLWINGVISISDVSEKGLYVSVSTPYWYSKSVSSPIYFEIESVSISEDTIHLNFKQANGVVYTYKQKSRTGYATLSIDLNKSDSFNGDIEINFMINDENDGYFRAYANNSTYK